MIVRDDKDGRVMITVHAVPRASRSEIVGEHNGALRVRLAAAPVEGAANEELVRLIAKAFGVSQKYVEITAGHASKIKQVRISGSSCNAIDHMLKLIAVKKG